MRIVLFDCEVFAHDFLFVFKELNGEFLCISHNNNDQIEQFLSADDIVLCGFNNKRYDNIILTAVLNGATPEQVKEINDFIIGSDTSGWKHPYLQGNRIYFSSFDLMDDTQNGVSLKSVEAHLGMDIEETEVDFDLPRSLTEEELTLTVHYCKHDVEATEELFKIRKGYLQTKINLGQRVGLRPEKSLGMTNAQLTAAILHAKRREWDDGREYVYPPNLDLTVIPKEILDFFDTIHDMSIPDDVLFKTSIEIVIGGMKCKYGWGGGHGSLTCFYEESTDTRVIQNRDVASLYPSLIELYKYLSRNVPDPQLFYDIRKERIQAKHDNNKQLAKDLKLPLNTVSGAQENKANDLYDPLPTRSLRISGQLFLTELMMKLLNGCKTIKLFNFNTDGLAYSIDKSEVPVADAICAEWEKRTGFELEVDEIAKIWIKDVNNLLIIKTDSSVKTVGGYLNYGISEKSGWAINNNAIICKKAAIDYFVKGIPVEDTINGCNDMSQFQIIAKASGKYKSVYQIVDGEKIPVQRCNRVYAAKESRLGTLFKTHKQTGKDAKIGGLPLHCLIDNKNIWTIDDIDKDFYIALAQKYVNDFLGVGRRKTGSRKLTIIKNKITKLLEANSMATAKKTEPAPEEITQPDVKSMNVYERLLNVRAELLQCGMEKTGKHLKPNYTYFTLNDIVPKATQLCLKYRITVATRFKDTEAEATVYNLDSPEDMLTFNCPIEKLTAIERSSDGKAITNAMQDLGSMQTYARRYLYLLVFDIVEYDTIDGDEGEDGNGITLTRSAPATASERAEVVQELTSPEKQATEQQFEALKQGCAIWRELDPNCDENIQKIALQTNGFKTGSKEMVEQLLMYIATAIKELQDIQAAVQAVDEGDNV